MSEQVTFNQPVHVDEEDDYRLFESSRNKETTALAAEYASMIRRQRVIIGMVEIYAKRVPPGRREGVVAAIGAQAADLVQMRKRFAAAIQEAERAQSRVFDARMRFENESSMLVAGMSRPKRILGRIFRKREPNPVIPTQQAVHESIMELKSAMDDWGRSMSMVYRLLPEWRRIQDEMLSFAETQQGAYRKLESEISGPSRDMPSMPASVPAQAVAHPVPTKNVRARTH